MMKETAAIWLSTIMLFILFCTSLVIAEPTLPTLRFFSDADLWAAQAALREDNSIHAISGCETTEDVSDTSWRARGKVAGSTSTRNDDNSTCHYPRGSVLILIVFVNHDGGTWTMSEMNTEAAQIKVAKDFYLDEAPSGAILSFDNESTSGYFSFVATVNGTLTGPPADDQVAEAILDLGYADWDGDGYPYDDFNAFFQDPNGPLGIPALAGGWDNVISIFIAADVSGRAFARSAWSYLKMDEGDGPDTYIHEMGHPFGQCDEYVSSGCGCDDCRNSYYTTYLYESVANGNCQNSCPSDVPCVMRSDNSRQICVYTKPWWSWSDDNSDGVLNTVKRRISGSVFVPVFELEHKVDVLSNDTEDESGWVFSKRADSWAVMGLRNPSSATYWPFLYADNNHNFLLMSSVFPPFNQVQFIVGDYHHSRLGNEHVGVQYVSGSTSANYRIQWEGGSESLVPNAAPLSGTWAYSDVVRIWDVPLSAGQEVTFELDITSGTVDLGMALFKSDGEPYWMSRLGAVWEEDASGAGADESYTYTAPEDDVYGLVVWSDGPEGGSYTLAALSCAAKAGDVNGTPPVGLQDIIYLVNYVFDKDHPAIGCLGINPGYCWEPDPLCRGEIDGTPPIGLQDIIYLVNHVFDKDRPANGCLGVDPGNCWTPVPTGCCIN